MVLRRLLACLPPMRDILRLIRRARENYGALMMGLLAALATSAFSPITAVTGCGCWTMVGRMATVSAFRLSRLASGG